MIDRREAEECGEVVNFARFGSMKLAKLSTR